MRPQNNSSTAVSIAKNTIFQVIGKVFSLSITVAATMIIAKHYGREAYGSFSLMQGWPALFFIIVDFGLNAIATRELSKDFSRANKYLGTILLLRTSLSLVFMILISLLVFWTPYSQVLKLGIRLSLFLILTQALYATTNIIFQVKLRYDLSTLGYMAGYTLIFILIVLFALLRVSVTWVSFAYVIGGLLTFIINMYFIKKLGIWPFFGWDPKLVGYLLVSSLPLALMFIFSQINFKSDSILLSLLPLPKKMGLSGTESVAVYALPYKVFEVGLVIPTFLLNAVYPVLVRHLMEGKERLKNTFTKTVIFLFFSGVVCGFIGVLFSDLAIKILGGSAFRESVLVLKILLAGLVIYFMSQPFSWLIVTLDKQKYLPYIYLLGAVFNLGSNLYFIPKYSFYASSVITHLSELFILVMLIIAANKAWRLKFSNA